VNLATATRSDPALNPTWPHASLYFTYTDFARSIRITIPAANCDANKRVSLEKLTIFKTSKSKQFFYQQTTTKTKVRQYRAVATMVIITLNGAGTMLRVHSKSSSVGCCALACFWHYAANESKI
jgi:hypothetical protein